MEDVNDQTIKTYRENFDKYAEKTPKEVAGEFKEWMDLFVSFIPKGGFIFEIGSATGRDARYFRSLGYRVFCTDIVPQVLTNLLKEGFETVKYDFRDNFPENLYNKFDGVFANAVLLHAKKEEFKNILIKCQSILKDGAVFAFSLKNGEGEEVLSVKMDAPRYFKYYTEKELRELIEKLSYEIINISFAENQKWIHVIIRKAATN